MSQIKSITLTLAALCLIIAAAASVSSAPTEIDASSTTAPTASSAPTTPAEDTSSTASMAVSSAEDTAHPGLNTTFTCYNRKVGYYADLETACRVYHFCMLGDYNGQEMYQRVSYLCLNETIFDQQALDCVEPTKMTAPCAESEKHYEDSNAVLRKAIVGKPEMGDHAPAAAAATEASSSAAPASSEAPASEAPVPAPAATTTTPTSTTETPSSTQAV